jgi:hypothetical protein
MQYLMTIYEHEDDMAKRGQPGYFEAWMGYAQAVREAGVAIGGNGLEPPHTATTLRVRDGKQLVQDGPFATTKEQLGGYFVFDVPDLDTALAWAAKCPALPNGAVEVRPVMVMSA